MVNNNLKRHIALALMLTSTAPVVNANGIADFLTSKTTLSFLAGAVTTLGITGWYQGWFSRNKTKSVSAVQVALEQGSITVKTNENPYDMSISVDPPRYTLARDGVLSIKSDAHGNGDYTIAVPQGHRVYQLLTLDGNIQTSDTSGYLMSRSKKGNLTHSNHRGNWWLKPDNGTLTFTAYGDRNCAEEALPKGRCYQNQVKDLSQTLE